MEIIKDSTNAIRERIEKDFAFRVDQKEKLTILIDGVSVFEIKADEGKQILLSGKIEIIELL